MLRNIRPRFWFEIAAAVAGGCLAVITLVWQDWIEIVFKVDPDRGSGWLEWLVTAVLFGLAVVSSASARREWRHAVRLSVASRSL